MSNSEEFGFSSSREITRVDLFGEKYLLVDHIQDQKMIFPRVCLGEAIDYQGFYGMLFYGCWEPENTDFVKRFVKSDMDVVDIGVGIGYFSLIMANLARSVLAIDPSVRALRVTALSAALNGYLNISFHQAAMSNYIGSDWFDDKTLILDSASHQTRETIVPVNRFDNLSGDRAFSFVKIDTDGHDAAVVYGMESSFTKNPEMVVMFEYFPQMWEHMGWLPSSVFEYILDRYYFYELSGRGESLVPIEKRMIESYLEYPSLVGLTPVEIGLSEKRVKDRTFLISRKKIFGV